MKTILFSILLTALCFGTWPLVSKSAGKSGIAGSFIMAALALLPIGIALLHEGKSLPEDVSIWRLMLAGIIMGTGFITYNFAINNPESEVSITVPTISALMIIVTAIGGRLAFAEALTFPKIIGIALLIGGIICLRPARQPSSLSSEEPQHISHILE